MTEGTPAFEWLHQQLMCRRPSCTEKCATLVCKPKRSLRTSAVLSGDQPEVRGPGSNHPVSKVQNQLDARPHGSLGVLYSVSASEYKEQD